MTIETIELGTPTATGGALVAVDNMTTTTATNVFVQFIKVAYGADGTFILAETGAGLPVALGSTATIPVSVGEWTATEVVSVQDDSLANVISTDNSTTAGLAAGGTFTGVAEDVSAFTAITTTIIADRPSQTDLMQFQFSDDGTNFDDINRFTLSTGTATAAARRFQFPVTAQFYRVVYTNTTTASQDNFRVQTIKHRRDVMESVHRIEDNTSPDRSADLTKSVIIAQINGSGDFIPVQANAAGILKIGGGVEVDTWNATEQVLTSPLATATQPVSVGTWTATGEVQTGQDTATEHNITTHPYGSYSDQVTAFLSVTATTVATLATAAGSDTFNDLVALYVSNHATSAVGISVGETTTATLFNPQIAGDGGGFIWQPVKPTRQVSSNAPWVVAIDAAIASPGMTITAEFQTAT